jgi:hypothetical protein
MDQSAVAYCGGRSPSSIGLDSRDKDGLPIGYVLSEAIVDPRISNIVGDFPLQDEKIADPEMQMVSDHVTRSV